MKGDAPLSSSEWPQARAYPPLRHHRLPTGPAHGGGRPSREKPVDAEAPHVVLVDFGTARRMEEVKGEPIGHAAASRVDLRRSDRESPKVGPAVGPGTF